ncbi:DUF555 domain-containing protein [Haloquadratum walsbyi]|jgi:uncharacterized protein (UPF0212 family)|uniref:UPF0212 family protein n=1 Tax=Haloquadratum walsbyi (strain DSM 16790 / HBSQ001) TaxID=362976 RepID=Q18G39_HALWD|nr:DUF555 domain-containing protein [Haloquadratum walsbyi]CAJ53062.1 UPF0212 family protein [Haloquadratum walsbyi DSM 16790]
MSIDEQWYETQLSVPVVIVGAKSVQDAINIAVAEVGTRTKSTEARSSEIPVQDVIYPSYVYEMKPALCMTDLALVALTVIVEMLAESHEESERIAKCELCVQMEDIPLTVLETRSGDGGEDEKPETNFADLGRDV